MDDSVGKTGKRRRGWRARWSLRMLFVLIAVICGGMAWVSNQVRVGYVHEDVAKNLDDHLVMVDRKLFKPSHFTNEQWGDGQQVSSWTETIKASPIYQRIDRIYLSDAVSTEQLDETIDQIKRLGRLRAFYTAESNITEAQVADVLQHVQIESLFIQQLPVGRNQLPWLNHPGLKMLIVSRTQFSNLAIDDLPVSLEHFDASRTRIDDNGLEKFAHRTDLKTLILRRTPTSQEAITELRQQMPWCIIEWEPLENG